MMRARSAAWRLVAASLALQLIGVGTSLASEKARVGGQPSPVMERRSKRAPVLAVLQPNTPVEVLDR